MPSTDQSYRQYRNTWVISGAPGQNVLNMFHQKFIKLSRSRIIDELSGLKNFRLRKILLTRQKLKLHLISEAVVSMARLSKTN